MCKSADPPNRRQDEYNQAMVQPIESHMVYELKQKREYHIQELVKIQKAIDAVNQVSSLY
jgi:hypothetical protein